jgi:glycosyltransferase involved in cell wall biosynthesis
VSGERLDGRDLPDGVFREDAATALSEVSLVRRGYRRRQHGGGVVLGLFFFPRGGSAQVVRALSRALPQTGWAVTLAAGSLGQAGEQTHAPTFFGAVDLVPVDYSPDRQDSEGGVPFQPSYEDRPGAPDRVFATVDDDAYERLVDVWAQALDRAGAARAEVLHLHHLTPANEAALRAFPDVPVVGQLHGTELALLRAIQAGAPAGWRFAERWQQRMRAWARACERLIVPPAAGAEVARLLGLPRGAMVELPSGVELELFRRRPLDRRQRLAHWRRWLVEQPLGWDESGVPGSVAYRDDDLWPFQEAEATLLYVGRYTAVKRLPLLLRAHAQALARLGRPLPLVLVGGNPGEWEGEHPLTVARALGDRQVFLAGWRPHHELPEALNAADLLVLPSVAEAFGLVLVEAMACGLPVIAADAHGPAQLVAGDRGWLVPADDQNALAETLLAASSDPQERKRRGKRAYRQSRASYGWPLIVARVVHIYEQLAGRRDRQRVAST